MIFALGILLWILALGAATRLAWAAAPVLAPGRRQAFIWFALLATALALYLRPHQDIYGGEDPGSYANSAIAYSRKGALSWVDPMLARLHRDQRPLFFYGHRQYGLTKDACLWVKDLDGAKVGPHFQPAFPIAMSVLARLGPDLAVLYTTPLFTMLAAMALAALAALWFRSPWPALTAALCYLLDPLTLWHGRCCRPEIAASFYTMAGAGLLLRAWRQERRRSWPDLALGLGCLAAAPFMHPASWLVSGPLLAMACAAALPGRDDFLAAVPAALAAALGFAAQCALVTDPYHATRIFAPLAEHPWAAATGVLCAAAIAAGTCLLVKRRFPNQAQTLAQAGDRPVHALWRVGAAAIGTAAIAAVFMFGGNTGDLWFLGPVRHHLHLTDLRVFVNMAGLPLALLGLAGWCAWFLAGSHSWRERAVFALAMLPGLALAGDMFNFMMTRYLMIAVIPMLALCLAALVATAARIELRLWRRPLATAALAAAACAAGLTGRVHLATVVEHRGLAGFLAAFADAIRHERGMLLCEYSRLAAPIEHVFDVPTLGLDQHRRDDYSQAVLAWEGLMRADPHTPAFFLTPFQTPVSDRLDFKPVLRNSFRAQRLMQARTGLPTRIKDYTLDLTLYRVRTKSEAPQQAKPWAQTLDQGNMGLARFANTLDKEWRAACLPLDPGEPRLLPCPAALRGAETRGLIAVCAADPTSNPPAPGLAPEPGAVLRAERWFSLAPGWWALHVSGRDLIRTPMVTVTARSPLLLAELFFVTETGVVAGSQSFAGAMRPNQALPPLKARWSREGSMLLVPDTGPGPRLLLMLVQAPPVPEHGTRLIVSAPGLALEPGAMLRPGAWQWRAVPLPAPEAEGDLWLRLDTQPPWDPARHGYPPDLGVLLGCYAVLPN